MGIDFTHCDARWGYSGFMRFRRRLALEIGIDLDAMEGFNSGHPDGIGFRRRKRDTEPLSWGKIIDPIKPFLNHSDCDGFLEPEECRAIAPRLRELIANWPDDFDKRQALELANGMDDAANKGQRIEFQ